MAMKEDDLKKKIAQHFKHADRIIGKMSNAYLINRLMPEQQSVHHFTFILTVVNHVHIQILGIKVNGAKPESSVVKDGKTIYTIHALITTFNFPVYITANGSEPLISTTFTMICDERKVFKEPQKIWIDINEKGGYANDKVPFPFK